MLDFCSHPYNKFLLSQIAYKDTSLLRRGSFSGGRRKTRKMKNRGGRPRKMKNRWSAGGAVSPARFRFDSLQAPRAYFSPLPNSQSVRKNKRPLRRREQRYHTDSTTLSSRFQSTRRDTRVTFISITMVTIVLSSIKQPEPDMESMSSRPPHKTHTFCIPAYAYTRLVSPALLSFCSSFYAAYLDRHNSTFTNSQCAQCGKEHSATTF